MTAFNSKIGAFILPRSAGPNPTLAILVEREEKIKKFVPRRLLGAVPGTFLKQKQARMSGAGLTKVLPKARGRCGVKGGAIWGVERAQIIREKCLHQPGVVTEESSHPPALTFAFRSDQFAA